MDMDYDGGYVVLFTFSTGINPWNVGCTDQRRLANCYVPGKFRLECQ
jgi:hypothetical protein